MTSTQPDLFETTQPQGELFDDDAQLPPGRDEIRGRLERILAEARAAGALPAKAAGPGAQQRVFPHIETLLPEDDAHQLGFPLAAKGPHARAA